LSIILSITNSDKGFILSPYAEYVFYRTCNIY